MIFIDWSLKGGSAYEVLEYIRKIPDYDPYIIFNTGYQSENPEIPQEIVNRYKVDKYLVKPVWENFQKNLCKYVLEAEEKYLHYTNYDKVLVQDVLKNKQYINLKKLTCICLQYENSYHKVFYFADGKNITVKMTWNEVTKILKGNNVNYFITNSRQHLVVKGFIKVYHRPYIKLENFNQRIEVVKDKLSDFEKWLKQ